MSESRRLRYLTMVSEHENQMTRNQPLSRCDRLLWCARMEQAAAADAHRFAVENLARGDAERAIAWQSAQAFHAKRACEDMEQENG